MAKKKTDLNNDEVLEELVRTQREKIERILREQKEDAGEEAEPKKEDTLRSVLSVLLNPEVQSHFVKAGIEILSGIEQLIRNAPMSENMKQNVERACDFKDRIVNDIVKEADPDKKPESKKKDKKMKKIDVE